MEKVTGWDAEPPRPVVMAAPVFPPPPAPARPDEAQPPPPAVSEQEFDVPEEWTGPPGSGAETFTEPEEAPVLAPQPLFSVQAALAYDEKTAQNLVDKLKTQGFAAYFYQSGRSFNVRVGPFPTRALAGETRGRLEDLGYRGPYISELR
jgi:cell division septation protein DedD